MVSQTVVGANGEAAVLTFDQKIQLVQGFTADTDAISTAFRALKFAGNTGGRMIDAVSQAVDLLTGLHGARRANILIIGESRDRGSQGTLGSLIEKVQRSGATVYSLTYSAYLTPFTIRPEEYQPTGGGLEMIFTEPMRLAKQNTVAALTDVTGGRRYRFELKSGLENDLLHVGTDLHSRYLLSFTPAGEQLPRFHRLQVQVKSRSDVSVHARWGYWSLAASPQ